MISSLSQLMHEVQLGQDLRIAVVCASESELWLAHKAQELKLGEFTLIGDKEYLTGLMKKHALPSDSMEIIHEQDAEKAAQTAMHLVNLGQANLPMKGLIQTGTFMKAVLDKENGIPHSGRITQTMVFEGIGNRLQFLTDCAININPDLECKRQIIENAVEVAKLFGYDMPKVALLGAVELVNEAMRDTLDSAILTQMNRRGQIRGCQVDGPLSLDNAISPEAASHKGIDSPVAGYADILVAPDLRVGNLLGKALVYYANRASASVIMGTKIPLIMTSRTEPMENRLYSIAAACYRLIKSGL